MSIHFTCTSAIAARFLRVGEIIERGGELVQVVEPPRAVLSDPKMVLLGVRLWEVEPDLDADLTPVRMHGDLMVATYEVHAELP